MDWKKSKEISFGEVGAWKGKFIGSTESMRPLHCKHGFVGKMGVEIRNRREFNLERGDKTKVQGGRRLVHQNPKATLVQVLGKISARNPGECNNSAFLC